MHPFHRYLHEAPAWPALTWQDDRLTAALGALHARRAALHAALDGLDAPSRQAHHAQTVVQDVVHSSRIEGEHLTPRHVEAVVAGRLGGRPLFHRRADLDIDGLVAVTVDADQNHADPVTAERLARWHAALFPTGHPGLSASDVGRWRTDQRGPMQVVSGPPHRRTVHFEAPAASRLPAEMTHFLTWLNADQGLDPVLKAALAHLHLVTLHPFEDGNGRLARALTDLLLTRADGRAGRPYSLSTALAQHRAAYFQILQHTQRRTDLDVSDWLHWFTARLSDAITNAEDTLRRARLKRQFWETHASEDLNDRQKHMLDLLFGRFYGKLSREKYATLTRCTPATAHLDLEILTGLGILALTGTGRATRYHLNLPGREGDTLARPNRPA